MDYRTLHSLLRSQVVEVVFEKKNGDERVMLATLMNEYLPELTAEDGRTTLLDTTIMTVWDVEESGWRSFRMDSLYEVEYDDGDETVRWIAED